jgi:hypothetical protein
MQLKLPARVLAAVSLIKLQLSRVDDDSVRARGRIDSI